MPRYKPFGRIAFFPHYSNLSHFGSTKTTSSIKQQAIYEDWGCKAVQDLMEQGKIDLLGRYRKSQAELPSNVIRVYVTCDETCLLFPRNKAATVNC